MKALTLKVGNIRINNISYVIFVHNDNDGGPKLCQFKSQAVIWKLQMH